MLYSVGMRLLLELCLFKTCCLNLVGLWFLPRTAFEKSLIKLSMSNIWVSIFGTDYLVMFGVTVRASSLLNYNTNIKHV